MIKKRDSAVNATVRFFLSSTSVWQIAFAARLFALLDQGVNSASGTTFHSQNEFLTEMLIIVRPKTF